MILVAREPRNTRAIGPIEDEPTTRTSPSCATGRRRSPRPSPRRRRPRTRRRPARPRGRPRGPPRSTARRSSRRRRGRRRTCRAGAGARRTSRRAATCRRGRRRSRSRRRGPRGGRRTRRSRAPRARRRRPGTRAAPRPPARASCGAAARTWSRACTPSAEEPTTIRLASTLLGDLQQPAASERACTTSNARRHVGGQPPAGPAERVLGRLPAGRSWYSASTFAGRRRPRRRDDRADHEVLAAGAGQHRRQVQDRAAAPVGREADDHGHDFALPSVAWRRL